MPRISAQYDIKDVAQKLILQSGTYTLSKLGNERVKYTIDSVLEDFSGGIELTDDVEITVSGYMMFVSDKTFVPIEISTDNTGVVFGPFPSESEVLEAKIDANSSQMADLAKMQFKKENTFVLIGDSLTAINGMGDYIVTETANGIDYYEFSGNGFFSWANILLKQKMKMLMNLGVGGERTDEILSRITQIDAYSADE